MRVLITGARGMVGSALLRGLGQRHDVVGLGRADVDLLDGRATEQVFRWVQPDVVLHAAGLVGGIEANRTSNSRFLVQNTLMGFNVVHAARGAGVERLLNLSSSCVYPKDRDLLNERDILTGPLEQTNQGYALAKLSVMYLCEAMSAEDEAVDYKTFVPCNLYGPGDHYEATRGHLVPSAIRKVHEALAGKTPDVAIWGDGTARREFMYVEDLVSAVEHALADWQSTPDRLNVGVGHDYSVTEYYEATARVMGYNGGFRYELDRPTGMRRKLLDVTRAHRWGWTATTSLEEGLGRTVSDFLSRR